MGKKYDFHEDVQNAKNDLYSAVAKGIGIVFVIVMLVSFCTNH